MEIFSFIDVLIFSKKLAFGYTNKTLSYFLKFHLDKKKKSNLDDHSKRFNKFVRLNVIISFNGQMKKKKHNNDDIFSHH